MKRIFAAVISAMLLLCSSAWALDLTEAERGDLFKFGIMVGDENGNLNLENKITRAEAAKMLCTAGSIKPSDKYAADFSDVSADHWAKEYIIAAKEQGFSEGDENGRFNPESEITNQEAAAMIIRLLGYEPMAESSGGYPAGYMSVASRLGITKDMTLDPNGSATRGDFGMMIYRALTVPLMKQSSNGDDAAYIIADGSAEGYPFETLRKNLEK